jgi:hypothetical protein
MIFAPDLVNGFGGLNSMLEFLVHQFAIGIVSLMNCGETCSCYSLTGFLFIARICRDLSLWNWNLVGLQMIDSKPHGDSVMAQQLSQVERLGMIDCGMKKMQ